MRASFLGWHGIRFRIKSLSIHHLSRGLMRENLLKWKMDNNKHISLKTMNKPALMRVSWER